MKSILLFSGGIDSSAILHWKRPDLALTIDYGQTCAKAEITAAKVICKDIGIQHKCLKIDCSRLGIGTLAKSKGMTCSPDAEWWPFRNQLLLTFGAMYALKNNYQVLYLGLVKTDTLYMDTSAKFLNSIKKLISLQEGALKLEIPAYKKSPLELIKASKIPINILAWTHSCNVSNIPCGKCKSCIKHMNVIKILGLNI